MLLEWLSTRYLFFAHRTWQWCFWSTRVSFWSSLWIVLPLYHGNEWSYKKEAGTKVLASQLSLDCRARRSGWVGSTTLISSAFTALLNCAEVGQRNRILTNDQFLSHSLFHWLQGCDGCDQTKDDPWSIGCSKWDIAFFFEESIIDPKTTVDGCH